MNKLIANLLAIPVIIGMFASPAFANWDYDFNKAKYNYYGDAPKTVIIVPPAELNKQVAAPQYAPKAQYIPQPQYTPAYNPQPRTKTSGKHQVGWGSGIEPALPGRAQEGWAQNIQPQTQPEATWTAPSVQIQPEAARYRPTASYQPAQRSMAQSLNRVNGNNKQAEQQEPQGNYYVPGQNKSAYEQGGGYQYDPSGAASYY